MSKFNINVNIYFTTSKIAAYLILIIGSIFSFINSDPTVILGTFAATSSVLMLKTYVQQNAYSPPPQNTYPTKNNVDPTDVG